MKYTFIMPIYNAGRFLKKSIESIINQSYSNWELIAVDDGSTDNSYEIIESYSLLDSRIICFSKKNSGPGDTRNFAISKATGDYIAFIDSDDYYELNFLEKIEEIVKKKHSDIIFISTINEKSNNKFDYCDNLSRFKKESKKNLIGLQMSGKLPWGPCSKVVKTDIVKKSTFSNINVGEEAIYSFDVLNNSKTIEFLSIPMYHYVHNSDGQHKKGGEDPWGELVEAMDAHLKMKKLEMEYKEPFESLVINSLIISLYRISINYGFFYAYKKINKQVKKYKNKYKNIKINFRYLNIKSIFIYVLVKLHLYFTIITISKIRGLNY